MSIGVEREQYFADHFDEQIKTQEMLELEIPTLHRICQKYILKNENFEHYNIIQFLMNYWQRYGNDSLIIFQLFGLNQITDLFFFERNAL